VPARRFPPAMDRRRDRAVLHCPREDESGRRTIGKLLTRDEVRRIAANIAKLPTLLQQPTKDGIAKKRDPQDVREDGEGDTE